MEKLEYHKLKDIQSIELRDSEISSRYIYFNKSSIFGVVFREEGFYYKSVFSRGSYSLVSEEDVLDDYIIKDNNIYSRPSAKIIFSTGAIFFKEFDDYEDAIIWAEDISGKLYREEEINLTIIK